MCVALWLIDCLFNNAGSSISDEGDRGYQVEDFDATMGSIVRSTMLGMKHVAPIMMAQRSAASSTTVALPATSRLFVFLGLWRGKGRGDIDPLRRDALGEKNYGEQHVARRDCDGIRKAFGFSRSG